MISLADKTNTDFLSFEFAQMLIPKPTQGSK